MPRALKILIIFIVAICALIVIFRSTIVQKPLAKAVSTQLKKFSLDVDFKIVAGNLIERIWFEGVQFKLPDQTVPILTCSKIEIRYNLFKLLFNADKASAIRSVVFIKPDAFVCRGQSKWNVEQFLGLFPQGTSDSGFNIPKFLIHGGRIYVSDDEKQFDGIALTKIDLIVDCQKREELLINGNCSTNQSGSDELKVELVYNVVSRIVDGKINVTKLSLKPVPGLAKINETLKVSAGYVSGWLKFKVNTGKTFALSGLSGALTIEEVRGKIIKPDIEISNVEGNFRLNPDMLQVIKLGGMVGPAQLDLRGIITDWQKNPATVLALWSNLPLSRLKEGMRGTVNLNGRITGPLNDPVFEGRVTGKIAGLGPLVIEDVEGELRVDKKRASLKGLTAKCLDGKLDMSGQMDFLAVEPGPLTTITYEFTGVEISNVAALPLKGNLSLSGKTRISASTAMTDVFVDLKNVTLGRQQIPVLKGYVRQKGNSGSVRLVSENEKIFDLVAKFSLEKHKVVLNSLDWKISDGEITARGDIGIHGNQINLYVQSRNVPLSAIPQLVAKYPDITGLLNGSAEITGTISQPAFQAQLRTIDSSIEGVPVNLNSRIKLSKDILNVEDLQIEGLVHGNLRFNIKHPGRTIEGKFVFENGDLRVLAALVGVQAPLEKVTGTVRGAVMANRRNGKIQGGGYLAIPSVVINGTDFGEGNIKIEFGRDQVQCDFNLRQATGTLRSNVMIRYDAADRNPFSSILDVNCWTIKGHPVSASVSLAGNWWQDNGRARVQGRFTGNDIIYNGSSIGDMRVDFVSDKSAVHLTDIRISETIRGRIDIPFSKTDEVEGEIILGRFDVSQWLALTGKQMEETVLPLDGRVLLSGLRSSPVARCAIELKDAELFGESTRGMVQVEFSPQSIIIQKLHFERNELNLDALGSLGLTREKPVNVEVNLSGMDGLEKHDNKWVVSLKIGGVLHKPTVIGEFRQKEAIIRLEPGTLIDWSKTNLVEVTGQASVRNLDIGGMTLFGGLVLRLTADFSTRGEPFIFANMGFTDFWINNYNFGGTGIKLAVRNQYLNFLPVQGQKFQISGSVDWSDKPRVCFKDVLASYDEKPVIRADGEISEKGKYGFQVDTYGSSLPPEIVSSVANLPFEVRGMLEAHVRGKGDEISQSLSGTIAVRNGAVHNVDFDLLSGLFSIANGVISFEQLALTSSNKFRITAEGGIAINPEKENSFHLSGDVTDLKILSKLIPEIDNSAGDANIVFTLEGTGGNPVIDGRIDIHDGKISMKKYIEPISNLNVCILVNDNIVSIDNASGRMGDAVFDIGGQMVLSGLKMDAMHLRLLTDGKGGLKMKIPGLELPTMSVLKEILPPRPANVEVKCDISLDSDEQQRIVKGELRFSNSHINWPPKKSKDGGVPEIIEQTTWDMKLIFGDNCWYENEMVNARIEGEMKITGRAENVQANGLLESNHGDAMFFNRRFDITRFALEIIDNVTYISGEGVAQIGKESYIVTIVREKLGNARPVFSSPGSPDISSNEILSRITLSRDTSNMSAQEVDVMLKAEVLRLLDASLTSPIITDLIRRTGLFDTAEVSLGFVSKAAGLDGGTQENISPDATVRIGRGLGERLYVGYNLKFMQKLEERMGLKQEVEILYRLRDREYLRGRLSEDERYIGIENQFRF